MQMRFNLTKLMHKEIEELKEVITPKLNYFLDLE